jgi:hypothetical protein
MAQISNANLTTILDRMARWSAEAAGIPLASAVATGGVYAETSPNAGIAVADTDVLGALQTLVSGFTDVHQQADFIPPVVALNDGQPTLGNLGYNFLAALRQALDIHGLRYNSLAAGDLSGLDAMLRGLNASTPTVRAHGLFNQYFGNLSPGNVFVPKPFTLATLAVTGATSATFTHVAALDLTLYGAGKIAIRNTKTEGLTSTTLTMTCTKSGVATSVTFTVNTTTNNYLTAGNDATLTFSDCTALVNISGGVTGDTFSVVILPDRAISAA